ncbi:concanavalin A-like lectin/glucanase [Aspergillus uvarum CBS 121591]|uniref:chitinase n=3 Tax=Aspergillus TaxID=5052 RepID=A0A319CDK8_9EURO|nr:concanavalin A-like lectin/glucanase [Aspergillus uvarum CBS 121591]XP_025522395.1 concanavalin A-like lectin/glucanase [Aspergillus japonicus CBS 114.51]PYH83274.1 concanavalin A-like lectin/glucanase [Aspergillus uvarum CBS 121591]PYI19533.1 concanavalin A-like lectin/glucanase [Aspergillus violaceofuscus CBS 115571]RAH76501.1 concanavalin A-like lectin/glucanase [Aspergillus japonicus CBS 114.51]
MKSYMQWAAAALAAGVPLCAAQTYTDCNPLNKTCPADTGLDQWSFSTDFTVGSSAFNKWTTTAGTVNSTSLGAKFEIKEEGDAPTIQTDFYIFFGRVEAKFRCANGTGIISTLVMESDDLDEIDWEQISTFDTYVQTDYFGKGNTTSYDRYTNVDLTDPVEEFHTYAVDWTAERIEWILDGTVVRTLEYADAVDGTNFPQTPMVVKIGIWAGGDPSNSAGTIEWAGGETDYTAGPFIMYLESVNITNYSPACSYTYSDKTGDYTSITSSNSTCNATSTTTSSKSTLASGSAVASSSGAVYTGGANSLSYGSAISMVGAGLLAALL